MVNKEHSGSKLPLADIDAKDRQILALLQEDGRISNAELARRINLSAPSTLQRLRKLEDSGVIRNYIADLDRQSLGYNLLVVIMVSLSLHQDQAIERFRKAIAEIPNIIEILHLSGDYDFMLKIVIEDMNAYRELVHDRLSHVPGLNRIHSYFVLGIDRETRSLPL